MPENKNTLEREIEIVVMTSSFYSNLVRNKLNLIDITDYVKLKSCFSLYDIAEFIELNTSDLVSLQNRKLKLTTFYCKESLVRQLFTSTTDDGIRELINSVVPLSNSDDIKKSCIDSLTSINPIDTGDYKFVSVQNRIFIILNRGYINKLEDESYLNTFIQDYLKSCYKLYPIHDVSKLDVFKFYVYNLK